MNVLILSETESGFEFVREIICEGASVCARAGSYNEALSQAALNRYDALIINDAAAGKRELFELRNAFARFNADIIFIKNGLFLEEESKELEETGIVSLKKADAQICLAYILSTLKVCRKRIAGLQHQNLGLKKKIDDIKVLNRAKLLLIQNLGYTEKQAHKYIENQAMNLQLTIRNVAMNILKTYEI